MGNALRDQLLKSGLVNDKQIKKAVKEKHKEERQKQGQKQAAAPDPKRDAHQRAEEKAERDRQLNLQRKAAADQKALAAQLKQLVESHRQELGEGDLPYHFADDGKIKRLYVGAEVRDRIVAGRLVIVRCESGYHLVLQDIAQKIRGRHPEAIVLWNQPTATDNAGSPDDPYAQYQVPDDLMW